jgi:stage V sporulation protein AA
MRSVVFFRMKKRIQIDSEQQLTLQDVCQLIVPPSYEWLKRLPLPKVTIRNGNYHVIDALEVVRLLYEKASELEVQQIGPPQTLVELKLKSRFPKGLMVVFVWLTLFIGSGLTIMNFHTDVSMKEVHERIYYLLTGVKVAYPLWLQVAYSFGIGLGMILFFNHVFKRRINEEPSPMELEMFLYQDSVDQYVIEQEKQNQEQPSHESRS